MQRPDARRRPHSRRGRGVDGPRRLRRCHRAARLAGVVRHHHRRAHHQRRPPAAPLHRGRRAAHCPRRTPRRPPALARPAAPGARRPRTPAGAGAPRAAQRRRPVHVAERRRQRRGHRVPLPWTGGHPGDRWTRLPRPPDPARMGRPGARPGLVLLAAHPPVPLRRAVPRGRGALRGLDGYGVGRARPAPPRRGAAADLGGLRGRHPAHLSGARGRQVPRPHARLNRDR
ncbi:hypothetical protein SGPA1_30778 [Streptomyces misionensis JCM 4497]